MNLKIEDIASHRNGISGAPFHVVKFVCPDGGNMIGIVAELGSDAQPWGDGRCFVLNRDLLAEGSIAFGVNSWRGDHYESNLRSAVKEWEEERAAVGYDPRDAIMNAWDGEREQPVI